VRRLLWGGLVPVELRQVATFARCAHGPARLARLALAMVAAWPLRQVDPAAWAEAARSARQALDA
jgi:hypothetical protein